MIARALSPRFVAAELRRSRLTEWAFIRECSRADRCSVSRCRLDPLVELRTVDPLDPEKRCPVSKPDRERFFSRLAPEMQVLLPYGGLLESEWKRRESNRRRLASMSAEQRARMRAGREKGMAALKRARLERLSTPTRVGSGPNTSEPESGTKVGGADA